uniref:Mon2_C domain-containing protein n=1 Tax=Echinostoma caproni TaxID=27848 RepID=A0A183BBT1_9TREM
LDIAVGELILPALRPCMSCADSIVRRAVATLLHSLIEVLQVAKSNLTDWVRLDPLVSSPHLLEQVFQMVSQLARDDVTGQRRRLNADEADWSVLAVALGPLFSYFKLCRIPGPPVTGSSGVNGSNRDGLTAFSLGTLEATNSNGKDCMDIEEQVLELVELQFSLVSGMLETDVQSSSTGNPDSSASRLLITQQRFWTTLTHALISLTDHLIPLCLDGFRDKSEYRGQPQGYL